jgi:hypothetical protein
MNFRVKPKRTKDGETVLPIQKLSFGSVDEAAKTLVRVLVSRSLVG